MSCTSPIEGWRSQRLNENGKRPVVFNPRDGFVDMPIQVPCGKCTGCMVQRSKVWGLRCYHEATLHARNCFVTLTYASPPPVLNRHDLQCFFKRLRNHCKVRYFACGEYGEKTRRPHYHAIIFGEDFLGGSFKINDRLYSSPILSAAWGHGIVSIGSADIGSMMYVAGYATKKIADHDTFNTMSRRPGIGHNWLDKYADEIRRTEQVVIEGKTFQIPRKYLEWKPDELSTVAQARKTYIQSLSPDERWRRRESNRSRDMNYKAQLKLKGHSI